MQINLTDVLTCDGKVLQFTAKLEMDTFTFQMGSFKIAEKSPVAITVTHTENKQLFIEAKTRLVVEIPCDRCLETVKRELLIDIRKEADMNAADEAQADELDEKQYIIGYNLDVDTLIYDEILLNWPMKVLCREDCKGICNSCGNNLNNGECGCDRTALDPRMAVIRDIFKNSNQ